MNPIRQAGPALIGSAVVRPKANLAGRRKAIVVAVVLANRKMVSLDPGLPRIAGDLEQVAVAGTRWKNAWLKGANAHVAGSEKESAIVGMESHAKIAFRSSYSILRRQCVRPRRGAMCLAKFSNGSVYVHSKREESPNVSDQATARGGRC